VSTAGETAKLPLASKLMAVQYKILHRIRHRRVFETTAEHGSAADFSGFEDARQCLLVTVKRSGEPVPTPVNFGLSEEGRLYFRTEPHIAKIKRLRRNPQVQVCPCSVRGKPTGPFVGATARILPPAENQAIYPIIAANWRLDMRLAERAMDRIGVPMTYVEITPRTL
jgi:PPOX class probable F420-dependent enzyme